MPPATMIELADRLCDTYARELGTHYTRAAPKSAAASPETLNNRAASLLDLGRAGEALEQDMKALHVEDGDASKAFEKRGAWSDRPTRRTCRGADCATTAGVELRRFRISAVVRAAQLLPR